MEEIYYFSCEKAARSGVKVNEIERITVLQFVKNILKSSYFNKNMILKNSVGNKMVPWGKSISEEDLSEILEMFTTFQKRIIFGYVEDSYGHWTLKKDLHIKYGGAFDSHTELKNSKMSLLKNIEKYENTDFGIKLWGEK